MFAKVFGQIFDSSIAQDYTVRHMFIDLLILADSSGAVDMTHEAISRRTNVPIETVKRCLDELCQPDVNSRSTLHDGKRIVPLDSHRNWGWQIVNYKHYRQIRDEEVRRSYFRDYQRKRRSKRKNVKDKKVTNSEGVENPSSSSISSSTSSLVPTAEDIYQAYPKKVGKPDALKAIQKAIRKFGPTNVLERTMAYAKTRNGDLDFVPNPATWFNQDRFNDDPETWKPRQDAHGITKKPSGAGLTKTQLDNLPVKVFSDEDE